MAIDKHCVYNLFFKVYFRGEVLEDSRDNKGKQKRQSFRLKYQINDRPRIKLIPKDYGPKENRGVFSYEVVDISERGIRFHYTGGMVENPVNGLIHLHSSDPLEFTARIIRVQDNQICLMLNKSIPLGVLAKEQRYLFKKYGAIIEADEF